MSAVNFPDSPIDGETFIASGRSWIWNASAEVWEAVSLESAPEVDSIPQIFLLMGS